MVMSKIRIRGLVWLGLSAIMNSNFILGGPHPFIRVTPSFVDDGPKDLQQHLS